MKYVKKLPDQEGPQAKSPSPPPLKNVRYQSEEQLLQEENWCFDYHLHIYNNLEPASLLEYLVQKFHVSTS